jgi:uncharacterized Rmd1/YagE family protein
MKIKAYAVSKEIDLNIIAQECGIRKKYTWEEPLILTELLLQKIFHEAHLHEKSAFIFSFGAVVSINFTPDEDNQLIQYLKGFEKDINMSNWRRFNDDYEIVIDDTLPDETPFVFTDEQLFVKIYDPAYLELAATVIAKSVALESVEEHLKSILDKIEVRVDRLEKGKLRLSDRKLAKTISQVLHHEYSSIAYIMILDKPDSTWESHLNNLLYDQMAEFFELSDRYEIMKSKTDIINSIIDGFATISHSMRGAFIEWLIVVLIVAEVILMILDLLK